MQEHCAEQALVWRAVMTLRVWVGECVMQLEHAAAAECAAAAAAVIANKVLTLQVVPLFSWATCSSLEVVC
jgi:hypothetical protein